VEVTIGHIPEPGRSRYARVLPDVTGLERPFDYSIPEELSAHITIGTMVRVELHGRKIGGWVVDLLDAPSVSPDGVKPIAKVTGHGPAPSLIDLADWAHVRWAARRTRPFLVAASPKRAVRVLPLAHHRAKNPAPSSPATTALLAGGGGVLRLPPRSDVVPSILSAVGFGPTLVVVPTAHDASMLVSRLRRAGVTVAAVPDDWAAAAGGVDVVVGTRSAAWMPCAGMAAAVVVDEHDEALQEQRSPTWHARDVVAERCRRAGVPAVFISPIPTLIAIEELAGQAGPSHPPHDRERRHWPTVQIVDRSDEDPWKKSMVTSELIERIRDPAQRVLCISNTTGRARILACRSCRALIRCERCDAAVGLADGGHLVCHRCRTERPAVCQACGASAFANLRPGVTRIAEELAAAAHRGVVVVTGGDAHAPPARSDLYVGTEAALYRVGPVDVVAFLEFDSEMLAPRFRASEQALALIVRAGRMAPTVLIQTFNPGHEVIAAAAAADPDIVLAAERPRRKMLGLPPFGALALVSGASSAAVVSQLDRRVVTVGRDDERYLVRSDDWMALGSAINAAVRPAGSRLRIAIDPPRV
jgi:primosomal protein N' (replication factor Y) (superfamily II helicase)